MDLSFLPAVNAALNGLATVLLIAGLVLIKQKKIDAHRKCMLLAFATSILFLICYLTYHIWKAATQGNPSTPYHGPGRPLYLIMLVSHVLLAMTVPVFAILLIRLGLARRDQAHRRLAKIGYPIWLYVSVTGVLIYVVLTLFNKPVA